jgi:hypothetical protein
MTYAKPFGNSRGHAFFSSSVLVSSFQVFSDGVNVCRTLVSWLGVMRVESGCDPVGCSGAMVVEGCSDVMVGDVHDDATLR